MEAAKERTWKIIPKKHIDPSQTNHTVTISTFGDHTTYNFTQKVNNTDSGPVPTPEITDVEVKTAVIDGEETTVVNATVSNPTIHPYPMVLLASTEETSTYQLASTGPNDTSTVQIPLDEAPGTRVQGELRLNDGNVSEGYDQVQFNGSADESTTHQNESYTVVQASWDEEPYHYGEDDGPLGGALPADPLESPVSLAALAGGILVIGAVTRRLI
ncbi:hypothetical protein AUR64_12485 [Haloprofundus marisrubri]|uniref:Uncharacterized protein n=2 Tax=Haloprofundus marisrubri TaxID=1514971 RepID=A0A0W1RAI9_9EURY|nr:hypothetical protein AUR64_12485 [Haloprofundus marisrubri]